LQNIEAIEGPVVYSTSEGLRYGLQRFATAAQILKHRLDFGHANLPPGR